MQSSCLVTVKRHDIFMNQLQEKLKSRPIKKNAPGDATVGVYDILPTNCMRKTFYRQKLESVATAEPVMPFIRGRAVEGAIARLLLADDIGLERHKRHEKGGIVCYTDISGSRTIIEIKDTSAGRRLVPEDLQFRGYLMQVLYYMVIADKEDALLLINYSSREMIWHHNDCDGRSWFYRPANAKGAGIECWQVFMSKDDYARELLWEQMVRRKDTFLKAIQVDDVSILPKVRMQDRKLKCSGCPYYDKCMHQDDETEQAHFMARDLELIEMAGFLTS